MSKHGSVQDIPLADVERSVSERFAAMVSQASEATAIVAESRLWTYAELDKASDRIAVGILATDGGGNAPILLLFEDVPMGIAAMLACVKVGRPYVPLSPAMPKGRMEHVRRDSQATLLLTETECCALAVEVAAGGLRIVDVETVQGDAEFQRCRRTIDADAPAWILYTSGSTGEPKGVVQTQRNLLHYIRIYQEGQGLSASDRIALLFAYTANIASHEIFSALLHGAAICPYRVSELGVGALADWLADAGITVFGLVPALFRQFTRGLEQPLQLPSLRYVKLIGEPVYRRDFEAFRAWFPSTCTLINRLGSSETGTIRWLFADANTEFEGPNVPVGSAVPDNDITLHDEDGERVAPGEIGEIVVQSRYLSPGYWMRPDLTDAVYDGTGADRRFHTGDMGKMLPGGCLVHLGRRDSQIKIRGFRVEIAEVEAALLRHDSMEDVLVMPREDRRDDRRLVAYYTLRSGADKPTDSALRHALLAELPEYMVPNAFVHLDAFPLAANGKILRGSLPPVGSERPDLDAAYVAPASADEVTLARLWREVLHLDRVGIRDNFFELGGHSLLATQLLIRIREEMGTVVEMIFLFEHPTIEALAREISREGDPRLRTDGAIDRMPLDERIQLEAALLKRCGGKRKGGIPRRTGDRTTAPVSFAQERMWFMDQFSPGVPLYNVTWATRLAGAIDADALEAALLRLGERHEVLRTVYEADDGRPRQRILPQARIPLRRIDLDGGEGNEIGRVEELLEREARCPFDLSADPILRATLIHLAERDHILLFVGHHIALDGWTRTILHRELAKQYAQCLRGEGALQPEPSIQYADFAAWQRSDAQREAIESELVYWKDKLEGLAPTLDLPIEIIDPDVAPRAGKQIPFRISTVVTEEIRTLARTQGATPFMVLAAAVFALLHRYTGETDFAIGTPVAGRTTTDAEALVGLFVNTLVLRADLAGEPSFEEAVKRVRTVCLEAYEHQEVPFEQIVASLGQERVMDRSPIVQWMLAYRTFPFDPLQLEGAKSEPVTILPSTSDLDLSLEFWDTEQGMCARLIYSTHRFPENRMKALAAHFVSLLVAGCRQPGTKIARLPMLSSEERERILVRWNEAKAPPAEESTVHRLFERAVREHPEKPAVVCGADRLTYTELNEWADRIAARLIRLGACPNELIGISMERSIDLVAGILGILKSGAAYLPLDVTFPVERLRFMMEDARVDIVLSQSGVIERLPIEERRVLLVDKDLPNDGAISPDARESGAPDPEHLAYVMYTSGSAGKPKGVMVTHRNVVGLLNALRPVVGDGSRRVGTSVITYAFDTSVDEIFSPLCYGGTLHVVPYDVTLDGHSLGQYLLDHDITTAYVVPDLLGALAETYEERGGCGALACLITGLAPKKQKLLQRLRDLSPQLRIVNAYGPTEVTYGATAYEFTTASDPEQDVPIGRPFPDYQVYIVNEALEPMPIGAIGELLIGGVGVSRGYLNRPELTRERFIPNPFGDGPEDPVYRTGDLVRCQEDGTIEFLGRNDSQVKIRGHRIELREIELAMERHPHVSSCHVGLFSLSAEDVRLAAYVVPEPEQAVDEPALHSFAESQLPGFMVPAAFTLLERFPLLPTGKIDKRSLPAPVWGRFAAQEDYAPAETELEALLVGIWQEVLRVDRVGIRDDFFALGGHSLLATRVLNRIEKACGIRIPIRELFERPTIAGIAAYLCSAMDPAEEQ